MLPTKHSAEFLVTGRLLIVEEMSSGVAAPVPSLSPEAKAVRDAESNLPFILGITIANHALALLSVSLRTYVRIFIVKVVRMDDYTIILAMVHLNFTLKGLGSWYTVEQKLTVSIVMCSGMNDQDLHRGDIIRTRYQKAIYGASSMRTLFTPSCLPSWD